MFSGLMSFLVPRRAKGPQAMVAADILVDARNVGPDADEYGPIQACIDFCNWCLGEAGLRVEQVTPDAWRCYFVDYYRAQVSNGGHGQFAGNSGLRPVELDFIAEGLTAMGSVEHLQVFEEFRAAMDGDRALRRRTMEGAGFGDIPEIIETLDRRFFALESSRVLVARISTWITSHPSWTPLPLDELRARKAEVLAASQAGSRR